MNICPYCGKKHRTWPEKCINAVREKHAILCGITNSHRPGCLMVRMVDYLETLKIKITTAAGQDRSGRHVSSGDRSLSDWGKIILESRKTLRRLQ